MFLFTSQSLVWYRNDILNWTTFLLDMTGNDVALVTVELVTSSAMGAMGSSSIHNSEKHGHDPATTQLLQQTPQSLAMNGMESDLLGHLGIV